MRAREAFRPRALEIDFGIGLRFLVGGLGEHDPDLAQLVVGAGELPQRSDLLDAAPAPLREFAVEEAAELRLPVVGRIRHLARQRSERWRI